jgi:vacuolar-type H+-ATPase subunit F/Vma7
MRLAVIGTIVDVTGFALAGADGVVCSSEAEVKAALRTVAADARTAIVLVSPECAAMAPEAVETFRVGHEIPLLIVLPESPHEAPPAREEEEP